MQIFAIVVSLALTVAAVALLVPGRTPHAGRDPQRPAGTRPHRQPGRPHA